MHRIFSLILAIFLTFFSAAFSQEIKKIELLHADFADFDQSISSEIQRLIGNVSFMHQNAYMYCDSAYQYLDSNVMHAFSTPPGLAVRTVVLVKTSGK